MKKISILILTLLVAMAACKKVPEVNKEYVDVERDLITVGTTSATIQCDYEYIATLKKAYLYYGEGEDATDMNVAEMSVVQKTLYVELAGLKENTTYSYYYEFVNGFNSMKSATKAFKTEASTTTVTLPTVVTAEVTEITANSAKGGGEVTNDGGAEVTERGICWSTNANPTLNGNHIASGIGTGAFTAMMENLEANTAYHIRAYATNEKGTAYGLDREFVTSGGGGGVPEGAINGLFTINANGDQVYFSQGNLQYRASTDTWRFAENQWDYVGSQTPETGNAGGTVDGSDNAGISPTYDGWIDLFGWGTSGWDNGNVNYRPYDYEYSNSNVTLTGFGYGPTDGSIYYYDLAGSHADADWGIYNEIINGGNNVGIWRTLSMREWRHLLFDRFTISGIHYAKAQVNGVNGILLLPDDWDPSIFELISTDVPTSGYSTNVFNVETWSVLETNGVVFLPAAGERRLTSPHEPGDGGLYWSSSSHFQNTMIDAWYFGFSGSGSDVYTNIDHRFMGHSVRLVHDAIQYPSYSVPAVNTLEVSEITSNSALLSGEVTSDGGAEVPDRGFCWSINENPTLNDNHIVYYGLGIGDISVLISDLESNTTYHVRAYAGNGWGVAYGLDKVFTTLSSGGGGGGEHDWVDLGLPSGNLWATCNVGANSPEEYGDYFAWGETMPKDGYGWSNYKYCIGEGDQLTKYNNSFNCGYNGFVDDLTILLPEDDAAAANWGSNWRIPTEVDWQELNNNTTSSWITQNGVNGRLFIASNGNNLFLPCAGIFGDGGINDLGRYGNYYSSSLRLDYPSHGWHFGITHDYCYVGSSNRCAGLSIRAVCSFKQ